MFLMYKTILYYKYERHLTFQTSFILLRYLTFFFFFLKKYIQIKISNIFSLFAIILTSIVVDYDLKLTIWTNVLIRPGIPNLVTLVYREKL